MDQLPPPALIQEILRRLPPALMEEILLHLPPAEPACLFRAALVCKPWRRVLTDPAFLRRYRDFHRAAPLLGYFQNERFPEDDDIPRFVPTIDVSPFAEPPFHGRWTVLDCRHGRVLLLIADHLIVWDPITGHHDHLPAVPEGPYDDDYLTGAVLCAVDGCDHLDCRGGPFRVIFAGTHPRFEDEESVIWAGVYSSETRVWGAPTVSHFSPIVHANGVMGPSLLAGDRLYFTLECHSRILMYELAGGTLLEINPPPVPRGNLFLMTAEDGGLGVARVVDYSLCLWSWGTGANGIPGWTQRSVISLDHTMISLGVGIGGPQTMIAVVGFSEIAGTIFIGTSDSIFSLELSSGQFRPISKIANFNGIFPYMSFYTPDGVQ